MPPFLLALGAKWAGLGKWRLPIIIGFVAGLALTLAYCSGQDAGKTGEKLKQAEAAAEVDRKGDKADAKAADARVQDVRQGAKEAKELEDATRDAESADDARRRRGCAIMRQQGFDTSKIAACR
jgi:hypothetical protein